MISQKVQPTITLSQSLPNGHQISPMSPNTALINSTGDYELSLSLIYAAAAFVNAASSSINRSSLIFTDTGYTSVLASRSADLGKAAGS